MIVTIFSNLCIFMNLDSFLRIKLIDTIKHSSKQQSSVQNGPYILTYNMWDKNLIFDYFIV